MLDDEGMGKRVEGRVRMVVEVRREVARGAEERTRRIFVVVIYISGDSIAGMELMVFGIGLMVVL